MIITTPLLRVAIECKRQLPWWVRSLLWSTRRVAKTQVPAVTGLVVLRQRDRPAKDAIVLMRYGDFVALHASLLDRPAHEQVKLLLESDGRQESARS